MLCVPDLMGHSALEGVVVVSLSLFAFAVLSGVGALKLCLRQFGLELRSEFVGS